jgi:hypothetical protein
MVEIIEIVPAIKARSSIASTISAYMTMRYSDISPTADVTQLPWGHANLFCIDNREDFRDGHIVLVRPMLADKTVLQQTAYTLDWEGTYLAIVVQHKEFIEEAREVAKIAKSIIDKQNELRLSSIVIKKMWE